MMKNEAGKVFLKRKDFEEMRKSVGLNSSKELQIKDTRLIIDMFRLKPSTAEENWESFSHFYLVDDEGNRKVYLGGLEELDYIEVDKESKITTITNEVIKTVIDEYGNFEEYWVADSNRHKKGDRLGIKKCIICDISVKMFGEVMCCECSEKYEYNLETDKFELIDINKDTTAINKSKEDTVKKEIKGYMEYVNLFVDTATFGEGYLDYLRQMDSDLLEDNSKRFHLYETTDDRRFILLEVDQDCQDSQTIFDLQIFKMILLKLTDERIDMLYRDIRNLLFERGMLENCNMEA